MADIIEAIRSEPERWGWVAGSTVLYLIMCFVIWWRERKKSQFKAIHTGVSAPWLVIYASQTGQAEEIAGLTLKRLLDGGQGARLLDLADLKLSDIEAARHVLIVASTTGDGDAPVGALGFEARIMGGYPVLSHVDYAVLALGDRNYAHFCAFGRRIDDWMRTCGAKPFFGRVEVDDLDPVALGAWYENLSDLGAKGETVDPKSAFRRWVLTRRTLLNPDSEASKLYLVTLKPESGGLPVWVAGDLAEILTPDGHVRDYSLASLPDSGAVTLYVREVIKDDGSYGVGSNLLTRGLSAGQTVMLRTKAHKNFHTPAGDGPLLLIGSGSGLAGLKGHILARVADGHRANWVIYGERHPIKDGALCKDLTAMVQAGDLSDLTLCFSRPDHGPKLPKPPKLYVQDAVATKAAEIKAFLVGGGSVMVCGGLAMGQGVDKALREAMGDAWADQALAEGRYRRDLY